MSVQTTDGLPRRLDLVDGVAIFVGIVFGSGIFIAPSAIAQVAPSFSTAAALWLVGGIVALCGAYVYAECGARLPKSGGFFVFYREAFGEPVAFLAGWSAVLVTYPSSVAAIGLVFADYFAELVPQTAGHGAKVAAVGIVAAGIINALGVRLGAWSQRLLTGAKVAALVMLCVAAFVSAPTVAVGSTIAVDASSPPSAAMWLLAAMVLLWSYEGWSDISPRCRGGA